MKRSDRLKTLLQVAQSREQQAAQQLGQSRNQLQEQQRKLDELREYRVEYQQRFQQEGEQGVNGLQIQSFQAFMRQLDQAISNQQQLITQVEAQCDNRSRHWQSQHRHSQVLDKTRQRFATQEQHTEDKRQQREADEHSGVNHHKKHS